MSVRVKGLSTFSFNNAEQRNLVFRPRNRRNVEKCTVCGSRCHIMIYSLEGVCSQRCREAKTLVKALPLGKDAGQVK